MARIGFCIIGTANQNITTGGPLGPGNYTFSFGLDTIPISEFTAINAVWTVNSTTASNSLPYHFKVLGTYRQTQYNTPDENRCTGSPIQVTFWNPNPSCHGTDGTVLSGFDFRVTDPRTGTGSGHSINHGDVYQEALCSIGSGDLRPFVSIAGTLGPLNNSTVAACDRSELYSRGTRVFLRGIGVKTVTDRCPACCLDTTHLDNYTTDTACNGILTLPSALTIIVY